MTRVAALAQSHLKKVSRAADKVLRDQEALRQAILMARASGDTFADIGRAAGLSPQRIHQIVSGR